MTLTGHDKLIGELDTAVRLGVNTQARQSAVIDGHIVEACATIAYSQSAQRFGVRISYKLDGKRISREKLFKALEG